MGHKQSSYDAWNGVTMILQGEDEEIMVKDESHDYVDEAQGMADAFKAALRRTRV